MQIQLRNGEMNLGNFGIEIEAYGVEMNRLASELNRNGIDCYVEGYNHSTRSHWKVVTDGSIHGNRAFELVSPVLNGADGIRQIEVVCRVLDELDAKVNKSCGLHVHHDARGYNDKQLVNVLKFYRRSEKDIDSFMPLSRRDNNGFYCQSVNSALYQIENGVSIHNLNRYCKVNLTSFYRHGTVEFRHHSGTVDFDKISNWVLFTALIMRAAKKANVRTKAAWKNWHYLKHALGSGKAADATFKKCMKFFDGRIKHFGVNPVYAR